MSFPQTIDKGCCCMSLSVIAAAWSFEAAWSTFLASFLAFLPRLLTALLILLVAFLITRILPKPVNSLMKRTKLDEVAVKYIHRANKIVSWALAIVRALDKLGFPVGSLRAVLAAVGAAVALAIKDNLSNLASGMVLLFTKPFKAGDFIEVDGSSGTIREIELMHTYLDTVGNTRLAIPNTKMMTATINNYSVYETRRQDFVFSISYDDDLLKAEELLKGMVDRHPMVLQDPAPMVKVKEHGSSSVNLLVRVWCKSENYWDLQFDLLEQVKLAFDENGLSIPFNQLDVHLPIEKKAE